MKRCSTCNRTYTDSHLSFCIDDGTPLTPVESEDEATVVSPRRNNEEDGNPVAYQPPGSYVPPGTEIKRRGAWPWILGIAAAFVLGIFAISLAAAILAPRFISRQREQVANTRNSNSENTNSVVNGNANQNTSEHIDTPPPTDQAQVLVQLTDIEHDWTTANINADKKKLERILADDYVAPAGEGGELQTKAEYIAALERDTDVDRWEFKDLKLNLVGDRATLSGTITYMFQDGEAVFDFTDKFVWRDGRWQATGSAIARRKETNVNH